MKKNHKNNYKKMDLRISLLNFNFAMIYIIHKILVLIKNNMNYFKENTFSKYIMMENPRSEEKIIKDIRNLFRIKKEQNETAIKDIKNLFRLKKTS